MTRQGGSEPKGADILRLSTHHTPFPQRGSEQHLFMSTTTSNNMTETENSLGLRL